MLAVARQGVAEQLGSRPVGLGCGIDVDELLCALGECPRGEGPVVDTGRGRGQQVEREFFFFFPQFSVLKKRSIFFGIEGINILAQNVEQKRVVIFIIDKNFLQMNQCLTWEVGMAMSVLDYKKRDTTPSSLSRVQPEFSRPKIGESKTLFKVV